MKRIIFTSSMVILMGVGIFIKSVFGQTGTIVISNADGQATYSIQTSTELNETLNGVQERFVIQYGDKNYLFRTEIIPIELSDLINNITPRIVIQWGDKNNLFVLNNYPVEMIGDTTGPVISSIVSSQMSTNSYKVKWNTNEFAICTLAYGTTSGNYKNYLPEALYGLSHEVILDNLTIGVTYYYRISCTDQSENTGQSGENTILVTEKNYIYLPLLNK